MAILDPGHRPGAGTSVNFAVSDSSASSAALVAGTWYHVHCDVPCHFNIGASVTAVTTHPSLMAYERSEPFQARAATDKVSAIRIGATSGTMYVDVYKPDARA